MGVEYINSAGGQVAVVKASRLVVLSAGAFGSPTILQRLIISKRGRWYTDYFFRSGIGSKDLLKKHGIKQVVDLPGVGENYMGP